MEQQQQQQAQLRDITEEVYSNVVHFSDPYFAESFMNNINSGEINMVFSNDRLTYSKDDFVNAIKKYMFDSGVYFTSRQTLEEEQDTTGVIFYDSRNFATTVLRDTYRRKSYNFKNLTSDAQYAELLINVPILLRALYRDDLVRPYVGTPKPGEVIYQKGKLKFSESSRIKVISGEAKPQQGFTVDDFKLRLFVPASPLFAVRVNFDLGPLNIRREFNIRKRGTVEGGGERKSSTSGRVTRSIIGGTTSRGSERPTTQRTTGERQSDRRQSSTRQQNGQQTGGSSQQTSGQQTSGRRGRVTNPGGRAGTNGLGSVNRNRSASPRGGNGQQQGTAQTTGRSAPRQRQQVNGQTEPSAPRTSRRRTRGDRQQQTQAPPQQQQPVENVEVQVAPNGTTTVTVTPPSSPRRVNGNVSPRRVNGNASPRSNGRRTSPRRSIASGMTPTGTDISNLFITPNNGNASPRSNGGNGRRNGNGGNLLGNLDEPVGNLLD